MKSILIAVCVTALGFFAVSCGTKPTCHTVSMPEGRDAADENNSAAGMQDTSKPSADAAAAAESDSDSLSRTEASQGTAAVPAAPDAAEKTENAENADNSVKQESDEDDLHGVHADYVNCEIRIELNESLYTAQAAGPSLEEARDAAVEEAGSIACADAVDHDGLDEDQLETAIAECTEKSIEHIIVIAAACYQHGVSIYTEGAWNENDSASSSQNHDTVAVP